MHVIRPTFINNKTIRHIESTSNSIRNWNKKQIISSSKETDILRPTNMSTSMPKEINQHAVQTSEGKSTQFVSKLSGGVMLMSWAMRKGFRFVGIWIRFGWLCACVCVYIYLRSGANVAIVGWSGKDCETGEMLKYGWLNVERNFVAQHSNGVLNKLGVSWKIVSNQIILYETELWIAHSIWNNSNWLEIQSKQLVWNAFKNVCKQNCIQSQQLIRSSKKKEGEKTKR